MMVLNAFLFYLFLFAESCISSSSRNKTFQWAIVHWEKKAPNPHISPTPEIFEDQRHVPPRRFSAPLTDENKKNCNLQKRRHGSAPILRLKIKNTTAQLSLEPQNMMPVGAQDMHQSPPHQLSTSPLDYFDPRLCSTSTPDELKERGLTKSAAEEMVLRRQSVMEDEVIVNNYLEGLLTCSLCFATFIGVELLQLHLQEHLNDDE